ncbi:MAG: HDOD domain-containing protein, partial [Verrucomicrobiales bacterium]|nr:HDOD domain-containing protein [Verrucomicrobiales bacterium]
MACRYLSRVNKVFYELKFSGKLPSPAAVGMKILQLTQQEDCGLDEITKVVRADPSLTGRILKVANAGLPKGGSSRAPLEEAVLKLGLSTLRDLVLGFSLIATNSKGGCAGFDYGAFWHASLGRAVAAQHLTELSGREAASEAYVFGLLCGIGELGLAAAHPDRYATLLQSNPQAQTNAARAPLESREFGIHHAELTEALLRDWGFPERLAHAAATYWQEVRPDSGESERLVSLRRTLLLAQRVVNHLAYANSSADPLPEPLRTDLLDLGIESDRIDPALVAIRTAWAEWGALLNVTAPKPVPRPDAQASKNNPAETTTVDPLTPPPGPLPIDILILEPNDELARTFEDLLRTAGKCVVRTRTVSESLALAMTRPTRLVIAHGGPDDAEALELCTA